MNKNKVNGILARMGRIQRELYSLSAEFGDVDNYFIVDNYFMTQLEDTSNRVGRVIDEVKEWKKDWKGSL